MFRFRGRRAARKLLTTALSAGAALATMIALPTAATAAPSQASSAPSALAYAGSCPAAGVISQGYHSGHDGVDIANSRGTPIYAAGPGTVTHSGPAGGYGQWIRIRHTDGTVTEYGHMYQRFVSVGQTVSGGQRIALMGSEGQSTGPHLHFEVHPDGGFGFGANPFTYMSARGVGLPCTPGGGGGDGKSFPTWGSGVNIRAQATTNSSVVATLSGPTTVNVQCQKRGQMVHYGGYSNDAWSYLPSYGGYISNIFIDVSDAWLPGVPTC
jgi:biotin carboxyl carrier protein